MLHIFKSLTCFWTIFRGKKKTDRVLIVEIIKLTKVVCTEFLFWKKNIFFLPVKHCALL